LFVRGKGGPRYAGNQHERRLAKVHPRLYDRVFTNVRLAPGRMARAARWGDLTGRLRPDKPKQPGKLWLDGMPRMVFVSDMSDAPSKDVPFEYLHDEIIANVASDKGRRHVWLWLTKLPRRMAEFAGWLDGRGVAWPDNLWAGTSLTSRKVLRRIDDLKRVPARVRFLSVEPQWQEIELPARLPRIDWGIQGGQSGSDATPFDIAWARSVRDQCRAAGTAYFLKQLGAHPVGDGVRLDLKDSHGGTWEEWPVDIRIREVPSE
jgi:protein gp37